MDINWQIAMTAIKIKKFYKKTGRRPRVDGKMHVAFDKRKVECFNCHNTGHFARECKFKGSKEGSRQEAGRGQDFKPVRTEKEALMTIDEGQINWVEQTTDEELNHALMAFTVNNEANQIFEKDEKLKKYRRIGMKAVKDKDVLQKIDMAIKSNAEVYDMRKKYRGIFAVRERDAQENFKSHYYIQIQTVTITTQTTQPQVPEPQQTVDPSCAQHVKTPRQPIRTPVSPSPIPSTHRQNWNQRMERELGAGYSFERKSCFVCGSLSHLIKDCDYYEKKMAREAALKSKRVVHANVRQATPAWTNSNRVNKANQFTPRPVQLNNIRPNLSTASKTIKTGRVNVNTGKQNVSSGRLHVSSGTHIKSDTSSFNTGKQHVNSGSVHLHSGTQIKSGGSRFNTGKKNVNSGSMAPLEIIKELLKWGFCTFGGSKGSNQVLQDFKNVDENQQKPPVMKLNCGAQRVMSLSIWWGKGYQTEFSNSKDTTAKWGFREKNRTPYRGCKEWESHKFQREVIDNDVQTEEDADLMVVSSTSLSEKIATKKTHSPRQPSSTPISKSAEDIMTFRKELDALALKHLGPVNTDNTEAISPSADHEEEVFSDADDDEMPEIRIYDKSSEGIFEKASYDDEGIISDFNNLPDEIPIHLFRLQPRKVSEALEDVSWVEAMQEELLQFKFHLKQKADNTGSSCQKQSKVYSLAFASFMGFIVYQKDVEKCFFCMCTIEEEVYVSQPWFCDPDHPTKSKQPSLHGDQDCPLTKSDGGVGGGSLFDVDVTPKTSHLNACKDESSRYHKGKPNSWDYGILGIHPYCGAFSDSTPWSRKGDQDQLLDMEKKMPSVVNFPLDAIYVVSQPQPSADPTPSQSVPATSSSHVQITQPPPTLTHSVQPPPQPSSLQLTSSTPPTSTCTKTSSHHSYHPDIQPTLPPSPQIPSPSYHDTEGPSFEPSYHMSPPPSREPEIQASRSSEESEQLRNLMDIVPWLESRVKSLEKELVKRSRPLETKIFKLEMRRQPSAQVKTAEVEYWLQLPTDQILAKEIPQEERSKYSIEERAKFLHDIIACCARKGSFFARTKE
ncbi:ribonuclease H-like domain-containing protein [Tanacetum coccineum]